MGKPLFENVGGEIKQMATSIARGIMLKYGLIGGVIIICGFALLPLLDTPVAAIVGLVLGIGVIGYGYQESRLAVMRLYAYGELVECVVSIEKKVSGGNFVPSEKTKKPVKHNPICMDGAPQAVCNPDGSWTCPFCDWQNPADAKSCGNCHLEAYF